MTLFDVSVSLFSIQSQGSLSKRRLPLSVPSVRNTVTHYPSTVSFPVYDSPRESEWIS